MIGDSIYSGMVLPVFWRLHSPPSIYGGSPGHGLWGMRLPIWVVLVVVPWFVCFLWWSGENEKYTGDSSGRGFIAAVK